jgi:hypothetical protein
MRHFPTLLFLAFLFLLVACEDGNIDARTQYIRAHENRFEIDTALTDSNVYELFTDTTLIDFEAELDDRGYRLEKVERVRFYQFALILDEEDLYPVKALDFVDSIEVFMRSGDLEEVKVAKLSGNFPKGKREIGISLIPAYDSNDFREYVEAGTLHFRVLFTAKEKLNYPVTLMFTSKFNVDVKRFGV